MASTVKNGIACLRKGNRPWQPMTCYQNYLILSLELAFSFGKRWIPSGEPINLFLYLIKSKPNISYTRTYLLMRKQCLMFMLLLAASERPEKNPLKKKFEEILSSRTNLLFKPSPEQFPCCRMSVICRITTYFYLACSFAAWVCTLEPRQPYIK